jgi:hypothetical protein
VLKALRMREKVRILYHGKVQGEIVPVKNQSTKKVSEHPLFGMLKDQEERPEEIVSKMRRKRNDVIIWIQRGNQKAARAVDDETDRYISVITYMELLQQLKIKINSLSLKNF